MKPDELLSDLTPCRTDASFLVAAAARQHARRRQYLQACTGAAAIILTTLLAIRLSPNPNSITAPETAGTKASSPMLTKNELLASFGDQPVALVTWPDGRQKLLTIDRKPAPARRIASR